MIFRRSRLLLLLFILILQYSKAQLWSDEFTITDDPNFAIWQYDVGSGGWGNQELQTYTNSNVKVENDSLVITVERESDGSFTSARIQSHQRVELKYGRIEARIKNPNPANGLWPSLWLLGSNFESAGWPACGSITLMQMGSASSLESDDATQTVGSALYWQQEDGSVGNEANEVTTGMDLTSDFYTYVLDWTPESITTSVDGNVILTKQISLSACSDCNEFHEFYFFILNIAVGGNYMNIFDSDGITAPLPASMEVDYIRVYDNGFTELRGSGSVITDPPTISPTTIAPIPTLEPTEAPITITTLEPSTPFPTTSIPAAPETTTASPSTDSPSESTSEYSTTPEPSWTTPEPSTATTTDELTPTTNELPDTEKESPTASPTLDTDVYPIQSKEVKNIQMLLTDVGPLSPKSLQNWAQITEIHLATEVLNSVGNLYLVEVEILEISQNPPFDEEKRRVLQSDTTSPQQLTFDANYTMQLPSTIDNIETYVTNAFISNYKKAVYLEKLRQVGGNAFQNASYVSVEVDEQGESFTTTSSKGFQDDDSKKSPADIGLIVGVAIAGLVVVVIGLALLARRASKRRARSKVPSSSKRNNSSPPLSSQYMDVSRENSAYGTVDEESLYTSHPKHKVVPNDNNNNGGSSRSLASSSFPSRTPSFNTETESGGGSGSGGSDADYNYRDAYKNVSKSVVSGTLGSKSTTTGGSNTICNEFTVEAPRGKLGLILETSDEGCPVVQEVKPTSPLNGCVQVGDRLHSVDGRDVTQVMSTTVTRVITAKQNSSKRRFVFARPQQVPK